MELPRQDAVRVTTEDGHVVRYLHPEDEVTFGRDPGSDSGLRFPGDPNLSRVAGRISHRGDGVNVTNESKVHSLIIRSAGRVTTLHPATNDSQQWTAFLTNGEHYIEVPKWQRSGCRIRVDVALAAAKPGDEQQRAGQISTVMPLRLDERTKEFATALVLCRPKLLNGPSAAIPQVPQLARQVLEATASFNLLCEFDTDPPAAKASVGASEARSARDRLTGRIHDHLRELRKKLLAREMLEEGKVSAPVLADALIDNNVIRPSHLDLLEDDDWLDAQAQLWWESEG